MRTPRFLVIILALLTFSNSKLYSQIKGSLIAPVYSLDSLKGFDENAAKQDALIEGLYGQRFVDMMDSYRRQFVISKYDLYAKYNDPANFATVPTLSSGKYSGGIVANAPCTNEDFENGTLSGWTASLGLNVNSQTYPTTNVPITMGAYATVVATPYTDPVVGTIPNSPLGGSMIAKINTASLTPNQVTVKLSQTFSVTPTNYLFDFAYWAVMQDASAHSCTATPYMAVRLRNFTGVLQACPNFSIVAPSTGSGGCAGIGPTTWTLIPTGGGFQVNNAWQKFSIDLTPYMSQNITIEVIVGDCALTGHYGYAYFDANCNTMNLTVNGTQTVSMPTTTVSPQVLCGTNATLTAPSGLGPYSWSGPIGSAITNNTNQTISTSVAGDYTLNMSPTGICNPPLTKIINLSFVPPTTVTASSSNLCASGTNTSSTLSASGASQYTWQPGGSTLASILVTPTITTIYTLTAKTGTCIGIFTTQIIVNPDPTVTVVSSNASVCPGQSATLTAFNANSYVLNPGGLTTNPFVVSPVVATTYTIVGTSLAGCTGSTTVAIGMNPSPNVVINTSFTSTMVCSGAPVTLIATGASIVWQPGGSTNGITVFNPTVTTTYTAFGSSGSCTSSATQLIVVDQGPSMTLTANPALTCPGNTTTLSVLSPLAVGAFTWNPGATNASSIVVTPTLAGGYSVSALDALGCKNTQTINPNISPLPAIVITATSLSVCAGSSATLSATGAVNYTWLPANTNGASSIVTPTANFTYTVLGANAAGCVNSQTVTINVVPIPTVNASASPTAICAGNCAIITPGGATSYTIQGGSFTVCPLTTTSYTLVGANAAGCVSSPTLVTVNVNPSPTLNATANPATICAGNSTTLSALGAVNYTWSTGALTSSTVVTPLTTQTYTVTGVNAFGCTSQTFVTVNVNPIPNLTITPSSGSICPGSSISPIASGATTYTWFPGPLSGSSVTLSPATSTTYTIVGGIGTCTSQTTLFVAVLSAPVITASYSPGTVCAGSCATLVATGAVTNYIVTGLANPVACPTITTNYTVVGIDANGCKSNTVTGVLLVTSGPVLFATANPATVCAGSSSTLTASGALNYTWSTGSNSSSIVVTPPSSQTYTVIGANAAGCTSTALVNVNVTPFPTIIITPASATVCPGGTVAAVAGGATSFTWFPGPTVATNVTLAPLVNTTYTVVGSVGTCTGQNTMFVGVNVAPVITASFSPNPICAGSCATLSALGATSYTVFGGLSAIACPAATTNYSVVGSNLSGCLSNTVAGTLVVNSGPSLIVSANPATVCAGSSSTLNASGALNYTWSTGANTPSIVVTPSVTQTYNVTGVNAVGCITTATVSVNVISAPNINIIPTSTTLCNGTSLNLSASGATSYTWQPINLNGSSILVTPTITTTYTAFGSNGACIGQNTVAVTVVPVPTISAAYSPTAVCAGSCATLNPTGAATYTILGLSAVACPTLTGSYTVTGSNAFGCISAPVVGTLPVLALPNIIASASPTNICPGDSSFVSAIGGVSYTWQPGNVLTPSFWAKPSISTIFTVTGKNAAGCAKNSAVNVAVSTPPAVFAIATPSAICLGANSTLSGAGLTTYNWNPGGFSGSSIFVSPVVTTTYTLTGNAGACTGSTTVVVVVNPAPIVTITPSSSTICAGGSVILSLSGASTYSWSDGSSAVTRTLSPLVTTAYAVVGFGPTGCVSAPVSATINVVTPPNVTASASPSNICAGSSTTLTAIGATNYTWSNGSNSSTIIVSPVATQTYAVIGSNAAGCTGSAVVTVSVTNFANITVIANPSVICVGAVVNLIAGGATSSYTWLPGPLPSVASITVSPSTSTTYTVRGSNGACTTQTTVFVTVGTNPIMGISATSTSLCSGNCTTLTATGALTYIWSNGTIGPIAVVCPTTTQTYSVVGTVGICTGVASKTIFVSTNPIVSIAGTANTVCAGSSAVLNAIGATNYTWSTGSLSSFITVSPATSTVYSVVGSNGGVCSGSANFALTVIPSGTLNIIASSPSVCAGFSVALLATGAPSFTWLPIGSNSNPLIDTPLSTTIYTAISNNGGCAANATISILVVPLPVVGLTANPTSLCLGNSTTLTATGATTYSWIPSLVGGNTFIDTPSSTTNYTVVGFNAAGCPNYTTVSVSVVPAPAISISASSASVCTGGSGTLTGIGATNYTWMPGLQTGNTLTISPSSPTTYTLIGSNGGCTGTTSIFIGINPLPNINASASSVSICPGDSTQLTASGGISYTWQPAGLNGQVITDHPAATTTYTVYGQNANGCVNSANVTVFVNPMANITAVASPTGICQGGTVTLTAGGGLSYTWNPGATTINPLNVTPNISTVYTLMAFDASGCTGSFTVPVSVFLNPTITVSPLNFTVCAGSSVTLTAIGATNYTWLPGGPNSSVTVENPNVFTTYTVNGDNGGLCFASATVDVFVTPVPKNVVATSIGTVGCSSPTAQLLGTCATTNVSYSWVGPLGYSATTQNAIVSGIWGTFTLIVTDNVTGCSATDTTIVPTDNSIPLVLPVASGSITCAVSTVTLNAVNTTTNPAYSWIGPAAFTSTIQSPTVTFQGTYTITVTDLSSTCSSSAVVTVGTHTRVTIAATITPATCNTSGASNNDASISVAGFTLTDLYDLVSGASYTGTATYTNATPIPTNGIISSNLANPSTTVAYTIRLFDGNGCVKDTTLFLVPVDCSLRTLGIAKAVSASSINPDGSYDVTYKVVVKNYDTGTLKGIQLTENLANTFPGSTTFTVMNTPTVNPPSSGLTMNNTFDGVTQPNLLTSAANTLASGNADTVTFTVKVRTSLFFVGFKNSVIGLALNAADKTISDSSNTGLNPDPDGDRNPYNNNIPTIISFSPNLFFGITKEGEIHKSDNESYDITYTITIHNLGNDTIRNVTLRDSLFGKTIKNSATYSMRSGPVAVGLGLTAMPSYDGKTNINLIDPLTSKMPPKTVSYVYFTINVIPGTENMFSNSAYGNALCAISSTQNITVSDTSNTGNNPDVNGNGIWNEPSDNVPTVLLVPGDHPLFIPQGFSPNGDNTNQYWVIQGLPYNTINEVTIFNRWGNKVYHHPNYDNTWDGTPNVSGTLGKDKLPPGTYYYIVDLKGSGVKPIPGFVVIEY